MRPLSFRATPILTFSLLLGSAAASRGQPDCIDYATNPADPVLGAVEVEYEPNELAAADNHAYASAAIIVTEEPGNHFLHVVDMTDPRDPQVVGTTSGMTNWPSGQIVSDGRYAYLSAGRIQVYDVNQPSSPMWVTEAPAGGTDLALAGDRLYVARYDGALTVVDVSNPGYPVVMGVLNEPMIVSGVAVAGDYVYMAGHPPQEPAALIVIDVSNPAAPTLAGTLEYADASNFYDVAVRGNLVVVGTETNPGPPELLAIDVSNPMVPAVVGQVAGPGSGSLEFDEWGTLYALAANHRLYVYDVVDPIEPRLIGSAFPPNSWGLSLAVTDDYLCMVYHDPQRAFRLGVLPVQCSATVSVAQATPAAVAGLDDARPNPFRGQTAIHYELAQPERVRLPIYDVHGRIVRLLEDGARMDAGMHRVVWDGRDAAGRRAGPGVYFVRIGLGGTDAGSHEPDTRASMRLTLLE